MEIENRIMDKAATLVEALPYIQKFQDKVVVVKYGGSAMTDENLKKHVMQDVAILKLVGLKPIIVHGGARRSRSGSARSAWSRTSSTDFV